MNCWEQLRVLHFHKYWELLHVTLKKRTIVMSEIFKIHKKTVP